MPSPSPPQREFGAITLAWQAHFRIRIGESITVTINGHPERSEGSGLDESRSFAALRMTVIDSQVISGGGVVYVKLKRGFTALRMSATIIGFSVVAVRLSGGNR